MEFHGGGLLKLMANILRVVYQKQSQIQPGIWYPEKKKKKEFLHRCISKILFIDAEQLSKMQISLQVFWKDFVDRFRTGFL